MDTVKIAVIVGILASLGAIGHTLHRNGYNSGYAAAEAKYKEAAQTQSDKLLDGLAAVYDKYDARIKEMERKDENQSRILQSLAGRDCHNADSVQSINQRIATRHKAARAAR